jgi:hypothetical protein
MTHTAEPLPTFDQFWISYQKKTGKAAAQKEWNKLSQRDREAAMDGVAAYVASTPDKKFRLDPERFLKRKKWEDEIIATFPGQGGVLDEKGRAMHEAIARKYAGGGYDHSSSY